MDASFYNGVLTAINVQRAQEGQAAGTPVVEYQDGAMEPKSVAEQSFLNNRNDIANVLVYLSVMKKDEVVGLIKYRTAKVHEQTNAEVVGTVVDPQVWGHSPFQLFGPGWGMRVGGVQYGRRHPERRHLCQLKSSFWQNSLISFMQ